MESDAVRAPAAHRDRGPDRVGRRRAVDLGTRARVRPTSSEPDVVQLVLVDQTIVPTVDEIEAWVGAIAQSAAPGSPAAIRTGALFPAASERFAAAGFRAIDELALLERDLLDVSDVHAGGRSSPVRLRRMRRREDAGASVVDRRAFGDPWGYRAEDLTDVRTATPLHRARAVKADGRVIAFAISGSASGNGYLQRLAVDPDEQRRGLASALVVDSLAWMARRRCRRATVNTGVDNRPALALYESFGFETLPERLHVMQVELVTHRSHRGDV